MDSKKIIIAALTALALNAGIAAAAPVYPLTDTKHNLSSSGTGSYRAKTAGEGPGGTTEICIFCHTPHSGNTEAPLWNRASSEANYQLYTSDVLAGLGGGAGYWPAEDPKTGIVHQKTRICLSCHDGTIALGSVVNMPNIIPSTYTEIQMFGNSKIQQSAPGYIGIDLRDDHPVAIPHGKAKDDELSLNITADAPNVNLYELNGTQVRKTRTGGAGSYVECTSCHNPHDNQYGKFLVDSNTNSKICTSCHDKAGDDSTVANESIHSNTTYSISYPSPVGSSVQNTKCMVCHYPHKSGVLTTDMNTPRPGSGKYLLTFQEEQSCYNTPNRWNQANNSCHDTGGAGKGIKAEVTTKNSMHRVGNQSSLHNATEGSRVAVGGTGWLGVAGNGWHVECDDCHNAHTAGRLAHTPPGNGVNSTLAIYGAGGAEPPASYTAWTAPLASDYTYIEPIGVLRTSGLNLGVTKEYQICLKCHSSFAWGVSGPGSVTPAGLTDQAKEFNTSNDSFHPVMGANNKNNLGTFKLGSVWNNGTQTMYCSDCHGNDSASPVGPHGSTYSFLLTTPFVDTYPTSTSTAQNQPSTGDLCWNCHDVATYLTGADNFNPSGTGFSTGGGTGNNLHTRHKTLAASSPLSLYAYRCVNCHSRVPHGYGNGISRAMIVLQNAGFPYEATAGGGKITPPLVFPAQQNYTTINANCQTVAGCHHNP